MNAHRTALVYCSDIAGQIHSYQTVWSSPLARAASKEGVLLCFEVPRSVGQLRTRGALAVLPTQRHIETHTHTQAHCYYLMTCCHHVLFRVKRGYCFTADSKICCKICCKISLTSLFLCTCPVRKYLTWDYKHDTIPAVATSSPNSAFSYD